MAWVALLPVAFWFAGILIVMVAGVSKNRRVLKMLLWGLPVFLAYAAYIIWLGVLLETHAI
jgi:hypothetical protein